MRLFVVTSRPTARALLLLAACAASGTWGSRGDAAADEIVACVQASEQAQQVRDDGKYRLAKEKLLVCVRDVCPAVVRKDCTEWLSEVEANLPSIVPQARDESGADLANVTVTVDGQPFADRLDGKPIAIDPGEHKIRFEAAGLAPFEKTIVTHAREHGRPISVTLAAEKSPGSSIPLGTYLLGGVGAVGLGAFAYFWFTGKGEIDDMRNTCAGHCPQSDVDAAQSKLVVADISLGVGIAALGVATYMLLSHKSPSAKTTTSGLVWDAQRLPGGGMTTLGARF